MALSVIMRENGILTYEEVSEVGPINFDGEYFWFESESGDVGISLEELEKAMDFYDILIEMGEI